MFDVECLSLAEKQFSHVLSCLSSQFVLFYCGWMDGMRLYVLFNRRWMIMKGCKQGTSFYD